MSLHIRRVFAVVLRQYYLLRGSFTRVMPLFVWAAIDIILWGFITRYLNQITEAGMNFVPVLLGAVLLWDFFTRVMHGVAMAFLEDVWSRNFLNMFASPLAISEYLGGLVVSGILTSLVGLLVMVVLATTCFGLSFFSYGMALVPCVLVLFLFGIAIGIMGSALLMRFGPASEWLIWPIPALLSPFVGVFYPLSTLPAWMQSVAKLLPPSYVFEAIRAIIARHAPSSDVWVGAGLAVLYVALACWIFTRIYRYAVKTGLIARYSAESVS